MALRRLDEGTLAPGDTLPRNRRGQPTIWIDYPAPTKREPNRIKQKQVAYTRMTTFIDAIDDKAMLHKYGKRMALKGSVLLGDAALGKVRRLDPDDPVDKKELDFYAEEALKLAGAHRKRDDGTRLHKLSEYVDRGEPLPERVMVEGAWEDVTEQDHVDMGAYRLATVDAGLRLGGHIETPVVLDEYRIAGTPDRIGWYDGLDPDDQDAGHVISDLKTGRFDFGALKMAMQFSGYAHSKFYNPETGKRTDLPEDLNLRWGVMMNLRPGSGLCTLQWTDLTIGWEALLLAKAVRVMRNKDKHVFRPFGSGSLATSHADTTEEEGEESE